MVVPTQGDQNSFLQCKDEFTKLVRLRATNKRKITLTLQKLNLLSSKQALQFEIFESSKEQIAKFLNEIELKDKEIVLLFEESNLLEKGLPYVEDELVGQADYSFDINTNLAK